MEEVSFLLFRLAGAGEVNGGMVDYQWSVSH